MRRDWNDVIETLRGYGVSESIALSELAADAEDEWRDRVTPDTWWVHGLRFWPGDSEEREVRVRWRDDVYEFQLLRGGTLVSADRSSATNARAVLNAFLLQLAA